MNDTVRWDGGEVSIAWDKPSKGKKYLILGAGAGGTLHTPQLVQFGEAIAARGLGAVRFNFLYKERGKSAPDRTAVLEACYRAVAEHVAERADSVYLGGRSMGGRIGSHIAAQGFPCAGLVFLAYPLHPIGKPERIRDAHLSSITAPMLFLQGTRDTFATPELLRAVIDRLPNATLHAIEGGDHSHKVKGRAPADVLKEMVDATIEWATPGT